MKDSLAPVALKRLADGSLGIEWSDGAKTSFPVRWLRSKCPCAHCVDEWTGERKVQEKDLPADVAPVLLKSVGRYAMLVQWSDGHDAGIYSFEYLRDLGAELGQASAG